MEIKIRIGHLSTFYHTAVLLMSGALESWPIKGINPEWKLFGTGPAIVEAFRQGLIDLAYIGLPPAIIGMEQGVEIKCIAGGHMEGTVLAGAADLKGHPELPGLREALCQLKGSNVGVPGKGSIHDVILADALERYGLKKEVGVINFKWADAITEAFVKEDVRAAVGTPALAVAVRRYAGGKLLVPPHLIWPGNPSYGIVAKSDFLDAHPEIIADFLKKHEEAAALMRERPGLCARKIAAYTGVIDADFILETIGISPKYCAQLAGKYVRSTMDFVKTMKRLGYIGRTLSEDEIFDTGLIRRVHPPGDHYGPAGSPP